MQPFFVVATYAVELFKTILSIETKNSNLREVHFERTKKNSKYGYAWEYAITQLIRGLSIDITFLKLFFESSLRKI